MSQFFNKHSCDYRPSWSQLIPITIIIESIIPHTHQRRRSVLKRGGRGDGGSSFLVLYGALTSSPGLFPIKNGKSPRDDVDGAFQ